MHFDPNSLYNLVHLYLSSFLLEIRTNLETAADSDRPIKQICIKILDPKQKVRLLSLLSTIFCVSQCNFINMQNNSTGYTLFSLYIYYTFSNSVLYNELKLHFLHILITIENVSRFILIYRFFFYCPVVGLLSNFIQPHGLINHLEIAFWS